MLYPSQLSLLLNNITLRPHTPGGSVEGAVQLPQAAWLTQPVKQSNIDLTEVKNRIVVTRAWGVCMCVCVCVCVCVCACMAGVRDIGERMNNGYRHAV
jgi:hypothetical protein